MGLGLRTSKKGLGLLLASNIGGYTGFCEDCIRFYGEYVGLYAWGLCRIKGLGFCVVVHPKRRIEWKRAWSMKWKLGLSGVCRGSC